MNQKWNLQDIRPAQPRRPRGTEGGESLEAVRVVNRRQTNAPKEEPENLSVKVVNGNKKNRRTIFYAFAIFFAIVAGSFYISHLMDGAEVTVNPRYREPNVNATMTAVSTQQPGELVYEIMELSESGERQVSATGEETVVQQAEGSVIVYNEHSTEPIRLITNTRFESANGLIFRAKDPVLVPGYTRNSAGDIIPGTITAAVFADQPGEQYNLAPTTFTIPGFAGSPEFENVYAESVESLRGGFDGVRFIIDESELQTAQQSLRLELRNALLEQVDTERPAGFILFPGGISFTYESLPSVEYGDNLATIKERATLRVPIFQEHDFAAYIAQATIPGYEQSPVRIDNANVLELNYTSATTSVSNIAAMDSLEFTLVGRPLIVWTFDEEQFLRDLAGQNKTALPSVQGGYPAIERTYAVIRPFWRNTFPDNVDSIRIEEVLAER